MKTKADRLSFYRVLLTTILLFSLVSSNSQTNSDSLGKILLSTSDDSLKFQTIIKLTESIIDISPHSAYLLLDEAELIIADNPLLNHKVKILNLRSLVFQNLGKYPESLEILFKAKYLIESDANLNIDSTNISDYLQVISNIGVIFYNTGKFNEAIEYFESGLDALSINERKYSLEKLKPEFFRFNLNMGAVHTKIRDFEKAGFYFTRALQYLDENNKKSYGILLNNLSIVARENKDITKAFDLIYKAIDACEEANYIKGLTQSYNNLGSCFIYNKDYPNALKTYKKALEMAEQYGFDHSSEIALQLLSGVYDSIGDYKNAYLTHVLFKHLSDSLLNAENIRLVTRLELQEKFDKRMNEAKLLQKEREAVQHKRELIFTLVIVFIAMGLVILILLYFLQRSKSKRHQLEAEKTSLRNQGLRIEKSQLEETLEFKNKELATNVMYMIRKNELITQISEKLIKSKLAFKKENQRMIDEIIKDLQSSTDDDVWKEFEIRFQQVHNDFYEKLNERYPNLSANEKRLCAFLRLNMSTKEISAITYQSINSITVARSRLRKKLELDSEDNLITFLEAI